MDLQSELDNIWRGWTIKETLGEGAFGRVYAIERNEFGNVYRSALKVLEVPRSQDEVKSIRAEGMDEDSVTSYFYSMVEDIVAEFTLMSRLQGNSHIVSYQDHAVIEKQEGFGWLIFIRMELLTSLTDILQTETLRGRDFLKLGMDICKALEVCSQYNIIHRDIKPDNIFRSDTGDYKLGDFGIARQLEKTMAGLSRKGTFAYMAPEVYHQQSYNETVDIYSLGILLYRLFNNNRMPFLPAYPEPVTYQDKEAADRIRLSGEDMPDPCNADESLSRVIRKACAYKPVDRYQTAKELYDDLLYLHERDDETDVGFVDSEAWTGADARVHDGQNNHTYPIKENEQEHPEYGQTVGLWKPVEEIPEFQFEDDHSDQKEDVPKPSPKKQWMIPALFAAAIVVLIVLGSVYLHRSKDNAENGTAASTDGANKQGGDGTDDTEDDASISGSESDENVHVFNGHTYQLFEIGIEWYDARDVCEQAGGHLAVITSEEEQEFINSLLEEGTRNNYWLGGSRDGEPFSWITGEPWVYEHWAENQPDSMEKDVLMAYRVDNPNTNSLEELGEWQEHSYTGEWGIEEFFFMNHFGFICEWEKQMSEDDMEKAASAIEQAVNELFGKEQVSN